MQAPEHTAISENLLFFDKSRSICHQQLLQILNLRHELLALIGILHHHTLRVEFYDESCGLDILSLFNRFLTALERVMLHQLHAVRVIYQRIARNTRFGLIGFGETAVNYQ